MDHLIDIVEYRHPEIPLILALIILLGVYAAVKHDRIRRAANVLLAGVSSALVVCNYLHIFIETEDVLELLEEEFLPLTILALLAMLGAQCVFCMFYSKKVLTRFLILHTLLLRLPTVIIPMDNILMVFFFGLFIELAAIVVYVLHLAGLIAADIAAVQAARATGTHSTV